MNVQRKKLIPGSEQNWIEEATRPEIFQRGDYASYVPRWQRNFSRERLLFLPFGLIGRKPEQALHTLESFLEIPPGEYRNARTKIHRSPELKIPDRVVDLLREKLAPQEEFLVDLFGREFAECT
jgi:hypothetical protein